MSCPFLDPETLARMPAQKREEMKEIYERMKKGEKDHLKIGIKDEDIDMMSAENMMMGMTGASISTTNTNTNATNSDAITNDSKNNSNKMPEAKVSASPSSVYPSACPMSQAASSGGSEE